VLSGHRSVTISSHRLMGGGEVWNVRRIEFLLVGVGVCLVALALVVLVLGVCALLLGY
jgi:hypothetical protein